MKEMFYNMLEGTYGDKNYSDIRKYVTDSQIFEEKHSKTTKENIKFFFAHKFFAKTKHDNLYLYLVSSTFHLLRLARECTEYLNSSSKKFGVRELVLNGADHVNKPSKHVFEPIYLKLMFFDIYFHLFSEIKRRESSK